MRDEVEQFLKRVAQMRAAAEAQARAAQQRVAPLEPASRPQLAPPPVPQPVSSPPVAAEIVEAELAETADGVARHVSEHLRGTEQIAEHTRHLGEEVDQADDKLAAHLHQVFDHQVGRLKKSATDVAAEAAADAQRTGITAGNIAGMLLSPQSVRNAIILGEILKRPEE